MNTTKSQNTQGSRDTQSKAALERYVRNLKMIIAALSVGLVACIAYILLSPGPAPAPPPMMNSGAQQQTAPTPAATQTESPADAPAPGTQSPTTATPTPTPTPATTTPAGQTSGKINPPHGQPGHRCDIPVGNPLP